MVQPVKAWRNTDAAIQPTPVHGRRSVCSRDRVGRVRWGFDRTPQPTTVVDSTTLRFTITPSPWEADAAVTGELAEADLNLEYPDFAYDFREIHTDIVTNHIGVDAAPLFPESFTTTGDTHLIA